MAEEKKRLSVAEMLAAARKADAGGAAGGGAKPAIEAPAPAAETAAPAEEAASEIEAAAPAPKTPSAKPAKPVTPVKAVAAASGSGGKLSVAEMLAAARAQKAQGAAGPSAEAAKPAASKPAAAKAPAAKPAAVAKPAAKPAAAEKPAAKPAAAAAIKAPPAEPKQTASISAARGEKPGPMTKAEAAAKPQPSREAAAAKAKLTVPPMPPKPAYAKPPTPKAKTAEVEERRGVLSLLLGSFLGLGFTSLSVTGGLWTLAGARFMFQNVLNEPPSRFKVGPKDNFSPGQVATAFVAKFGVWVCNYEYKGQKEIYALRTVCTHLGCTPNWLEGEQKFKCPCHGSGYYKDGVNFEGPAPRPLERYAIRVADDGQLEIDKSKTFHEELGQWTDPACFVPV